jgi:putative two-component system protein, hydrogenase maturation factor HypX/HoxX
MRILLLSHAFNSLSQRLFVELREDGHRVSVELDINDRVTEEAVALFQPDVVLAPFLKRALPASVWQRVPCLVVHPGPPGDRGPAALDHAVLEGQRTWGVTVLQANGDFDAGPVLAWQACSLRAGASKASLYRHEIVHAAVQAVRAALARGRLDHGMLRDDEATTDAAPAPAARGWRPAVSVAQRAVDWSCHDADAVLCRVRSADGSPGVAAQLFDLPCRLFDAHAASPAVNLAAREAAPGQVLARRGPALLVRCAQGAVWIGHVRRTEPGGKPQLKLPAIEAFAGEAARLPEWPTPLHRQGRDADEWDELRYSEFGPPRATVACLAFDFHNGALSERQAARLLQALRAARARDTRVLLLCGGTDFFCNGIHLHSIEAAAARPDDGAADASLRAIEAIDDVALEILTLTDRLTVSALRGNAGAGGCFLALAADRVWAHAGVLLNPHYRNMGNLYGSEYWTYVLPQRVGAPQAQALMDRRLPMGAREAQRLGLIDECLGDCADDFEPLLMQAALALAASDAWSTLVRAKQAQRAADEARRPLAAYRADELEHMRRNFYGFDPSYHVARHHFVYRKPHAWTPRHLALHRQAKPP